MKEIKEIAEFNLAGWAWTKTPERWCSRLERACALLKEKVPDAWIIGLSEVIPGRDNKYVDIIRQNFPNYVIILPQAYNKNYRSAINIVLINEEGYLNHSVGTLEDLEEGSLLYNYATIITDYGCFRLLNCHIPSVAFNENRSDCYKRRRKDLRTLFEEVIYETSAPYQKELDIQYICMMDANASPDSHFIQNLCGGVSPVLFNATQDRRTPTWINSEHCSNHIDYICYGMGSLMAPIIDVYSNRIIDAPIAEKISDHALLVGKIKTNVDGWVA